MSLYAYMQCRRGKGRLWPRGISICLRVDRRVHFCESSRWVSWVVVCFLCEACVCSLVWCVKEKEERDEEK